MIEAMETTEELAQYIQEKASNTPRFIVAISGFGGSGKSTLSEKLSKILDDSTLIHVDDFIAADENGAKEGHVHDWEKLEKLLFIPAKNNDKIVSRIYDWNSNKQVYEEVTATKYMIIEGSSGLIQDKYLQYFDLSIWLDVPQEIANNRGKKRDIEVYHVDHSELWENVWSPREKTNFIKQRPDKRADILFKN